MKRLYLFQEISIFLVSQVKLKYAIIGFLCVLFEVVFLYFYSFSEAEPSPDSIFYHRSKNTEQEIVKGLVFNQFSDGGLSYRLTANSVTSRPLRWHLFRLRNYYELIFSDVSIEVFSPHPRQIESSFTHTIDRLSSFSKKKANSGMEKNRVFTDSKTYSQIGLSKFNFLIHLQQDVSMWIQADSASLSLQSGLLRLKQHVQVGNSYGDVINADAAIWNYKEGIIEVIGDYDFLTKNKHTKGSSRQFIIGESRIREGRQGPVLALLKPGHSVLTLLNCFYAKKKSSTALFSPHAMLKIFVHNRANRYAK